MPRRSSFFFIALLASAASGSLAGCRSGDAAPGDLPDAGGGIEACSSDEDCDDGLYCDGPERCIVGRCESAAEPRCDDGIPCTEDLCVEASRRCLHEPVDAQCNDDDACNGYERCVPGDGCVAGEPLSCDDRDACTTDTCDPALGCRNEIRDLDLDGFGDAFCGGTDCNDDPRSGADINPGATEVCGDGIDGDCDDREDLSDDDCPTGNDDCMSALSIPTDGLPVAVNGFGLTDVARPSCAPDDAADRPDAFFGFSLAAPQDVTVRTRLPVDDPDGRITLEARAAADCDVDDVPRPCVRGGGAGTTELFMRSLPAGEHVLVAETPIRYEVEVSLAPPTVAPPYDRCGEDTLEVPTTTELGYFSDVGDDVTLGCGGSGAPDGIYRLRLEERSRVSLSANGGGGASPGIRVALRAGCDDPTTEITCTEARFAFLNYPELPAGDYWVIAEPAEPGAPVFRVRSFAFPAPDFPTGDACSSASPLTPGTTGRVEVTGSFGRLVGTTCRNETTDTDAIFSFRLDAPAEVDVTTDAGGAHGVALRRGSCFFALPDDEVACVASADGDADLAGGELPAGVYHVVVTVPRPGFGESTPVDVSLSVVPVD